MEEFKFSKEEAMAELRKRLPPGKQPVAVQKSLRRLEACPDEPTLYHLLGKESLRALDLLKFQRRR